MDENTVIHILRNPYRHSAEKKREASLLAANLIENYKEAYANMRKWAEENGVDTATYNNQKEDNK